MMMMFSSNAQEWKSWRRWRRIVSKTWFSQGRRDINIMSGMLIKSFKN